MFCFVVLIMFLGVEKYLGFTHVLPTLIDINP
jgi:hypothetical protein